MAPTPSVKRAAWNLLAYVRREIKRGMGVHTAGMFNASRPAALHDELVHFLAVHDVEGKFDRRRRG